MDTMECCIKRVLQAMSSTALLVLPEDTPVSTQALQSQAEDTVSSAGHTLGIHSTQNCLELLNKRHMARSNYQVSSYLGRPQVQVPLFKASIELAIPNIILRPSLEEIQSTVNKAVSIVLSMTADITLWTFSSLHSYRPGAEQAAVREAGDDSLLPKELVLKPLDCQLAEHKDITNCVG
ncbi:hypothetical protein UPYG_G00072330 [Umbra pygmaea]|uniref:Uncharacterized protein n=1 Tax=Umbra pygmaea TaxID=75934 RepID=A0ABD0XCE6_UMBPY